MMDIDLRQALKQPGETFRYVFEGTPDFVDIAFAEPVRLEAEYGAVPGGVRVKGELRAVVAAACTRCLDDTTLAVEQTFDEVFEKEQGDDNYTFSGETLSLDKMVYDAIVLALPLQLLCGEDCKGLCPVCGKNLNEAACDCNNKTEIDPSNPFYKLRNEI